jgi:ketopantoate reductase
MLRCRYHGAMPTPGLRVSPLQVLVVGAGSVGQVYGYHLARSGAAVTFYVRARYRDEVTRGFTLSRLPRLRAGWGRNATLRCGEPARRLDGFAVVSSAAEVARRRFDLVFLAIPSSGMTPGWLAELVVAIGDAAMVSLTPSPDDRARLLAAGVPAERLVAGLISLVCYAAPLPGEPARPPSTAVWYPPASPGLFCGPPAIVDAVVATLRRGGMPVRAHPDTAYKAALLNSALMPLVLALEAAGWSFAALAGAPLRQALRAAHQALAITALRFGPPPRRMLLLLRPAALRVTLRLARELAPLPLETYLRVHFTKVGAQTRLITAALIERGRDAGLAVDALQQLLAAVPTGLTPAEPAEPR